MASGGTSGTVTVEDQRSYIKIETLGGKPPKEIHSALHEVCGINMHAIRYRRTVALHTNTVCMVHNHFTPAKILTTSGFYNLHNLKKNL